MNMVPVASLWEGLRAKILNSELLRHEFAQLFILPALPRCYPARLCVPAEDSFSSPQRGEITILTDLDRKI